MITELQKKSVQAVVNVFETGRPLGDYGKVTLLRGDTGHLTYGRSQTTLTSGNLHLLVKAYCEAPDAEFGEPMSTYLERLDSADLSLDRDVTFRALLREAGEDPLMQTVQDDFFDRIYWAPAVRSAEFIGAETALGMAVVYDSRIHGSWHRIRDRTNLEHGKLADVGEVSWIGQYVETRRSWLANHSNALLRKTVYRMDAFGQLMDGDNWPLDLPFNLRGTVIDEGILLGGPAVRASAEVTE